jgi:large subunit ribosomal protein L31
MDSRSSGSGSRPLPELIRATRRPTIEEDIMKSDIHPAYGETTVLCGCGNTFQTRSTKESGHIVVEVCSQCHPFYTGKQKILDSGGRVARFERRYGKRKADAENEAGKSQKAD